MQAGCYFTEDFFVLFINREVCLLFRNSSVKMQFLSDSQSAPTCDPKLSSEHTSLSQNDLDKLKVIAVRLNLQTRRGSYMTWRNKLVSTLCGQGENEDNVEDLLVTKDVNENSVKEDEGEKLKSRAENNELMIAKWQNMHKSIDFIHSELVSYSYTSSISK